MIRSEDLKLKEVYGGTTITGTVLNGFVDLIEILYDAGKSVGSSFRRLFNNSLCPLK